jgi:hypothetical protein
MSRSSIYDYTSIARPVDPAWPTNRAVLVIVPVIAFASAVAAWLGIGAVDAPGPAALGGALVAFGAWALTRELAPDDDPAAFVSLAIAVVLQFAAGPATVLPLFVCLFQVRVVNRTTGKPATLVDSALVAGFSLWAAARLGQPLLALTGAVAFTLDGWLRPCTPRQFGVGAACAGIPALFVLLQGLPQLYLAPLPVTRLVLLAIVLVPFLVAIVRTGSLRSTGDATGVPLSPPRVRAGMLVAALVALQGLLSDSAAGAGPNPWLWACLAGVVIGRLRPARARL